MYSDADSLKMLIGSNTTRDDELLEQLIKSVSVQIDNYCHRSFAYGTFTQEFLVFSGERLNPLYLNNTPVESIIDILCDGVSILNDISYKLFGDVGRVYLYDYNFYNEQIIEVIYTGGYQIVPADISLATNLQCAFLYQRRDSIGTTTINTNDGNLRLQTPHELISSVKQILDNYKVRLV